MTQSLIRDKRSGAPCLRYCTKLIAIREEISAMEVDCFRYLVLASEFLCEIQLYAQYKAFVVNMGLKSVERPVWM